LRLISDIAYHLLRGRFLYSPMKAKWALDDRSIQSEIETEKYFGKPQDIQVAEIISHQCD